MKFIKAWLIVSAIIIAFISVFGGMCILAANYPETFGVICFIVFGSIVAWLVAYS